MIMSYKAKKKIKSALIRLVILLIVFIDVYPLFWMITASFKAPGEFVTKPAYALNAGFYLKNYVEAGPAVKWPCFLKTV